MHRRKYEAEIFKMPWYWKTEPGTHLLFPLWHNMPAPGVPSGDEGLLTAPIPWEFVNLLERLKWKPAKGIYISPQKTIPCACRGVSLEKLRMAPSMQRKSSAQSSYQIHGTQLIIRGDQ